MKHEYPCWQQSPKWLFLEHFIQNWEGSERHSLLYRRFQRQVSKNSSISTVCILKTKYLLSYGSKVTQKDKVFLLTHRQIGQKLDVPIFHSEGIKIICTQVRKLTMLIRFCGLDHFPSRRNISIHIFPHQGIYDCSILPLSFYFLSLISNYFLIKSNLLKSINTAVHGLRKMINKNYWSHW